MKLTKQQTAALELLNDSFFTRINAKTAKSLQDKGLIRTEKGFWFLTDDGKKSIGVFNYKYEQKLQQAKAFKDGLAKATAASGNNAATVSHYGFKYIAEKAFRFNGFVPNLNGLNKDELYDLYVKLGNDHDQVLIKSFAAKV